jgi:hypothetical protein
LDNDEDMIPYWTMMRTLVLYWMMTEDTGTVLVEDEEEANGVDQVANHHKHDPEQGLALHLAIGKLLVQ